MKTHPIPLTLMRFPMPTLPCSFELPDGWLVETGILDFSPVGSAYTPKEIGAVFVRLDEIEPLRRLRTEGNHWSGFNPEKMKRIMTSIFAHEAIDAVPVVKLPELDPNLALSLYSFRGYEYRLTDGYHRFDASVAAGFTCVPVVITTVPELVDLTRKMGWSR